MAPLLCWPLSSSIFRYLLFDHAVPALCRGGRAADCPPEIEKRMAAPARRRLRLHGRSEALAKLKVSNFKSKTFCPELLNCPELLDGFAGLLRGRVAMFHRPFRDIGEMRASLPKGEVDFVFERSLPPILIEWRRFLAKASGTRTNTSCIFSGE
jgi:hypothetical protein